MFSTEFTWYYSHFSGLYIKADYVLGVTALARPLPQGIRFLLQRYRRFWQRHGVTHIEADAVTRGNNFLFLKLIS